MDTGGEAAGAGECSASAGDEGGGGHEGKVTDAGFAFGECGEGVEEEECAADEEYGGEEWADWLLAVVTVLPALALRACWSSQGVGIFTFGGGVVFLVRK